MKVTVGICTGCHYVFKPGPRFTRRIVQHFRDFYIHNHDVAALYRIPRSALGKLGRHAGPSRQRVRELMKALEGKK